MTDIHDRYADACGRLNALTERKCADCKHWQRAPIYRGSPPNRWGTCGIAQGVYGYASISDSLAYASDVEAYAASLNTHESFSCIQFASPTIVDRDPGDE